jgi:transposase
MRSIGAFSQILLCRLPVDGRKQINTLAALVEAELGQSPFDGSLFIFINRRRDTVKFLYYDRTGFAMWVKRLEKDIFPWFKSKGSGTEPVTAPQIEMLLCGYDIFSAKPHEEVRFRRTI